MLLKEIFEKRRFFTPKNKSWEVSYFFMSETPFRLISRSLVDHGTDNENTKKEYQNSSKKKTDRGNYSFFCFLVRKITVCSARCYLFTLDIPFGKRDTKFMKRIQFKPLLYNTTTIVVFYFYNLWCKDTQHNKI